MDRSRHWVEKDCTVADNQDDLDCHRVRLGGNHHPAELAGTVVAAACIRTADAAVVGLEDCREAAVGEEGSCTAGCPPSDERHRAAAAPVAVSAVGKGSVGEGGSQW